MMVPLLGYFVGLYASQARLVVEVDGGYTRNGSRSMPSGSGTWSSRGIALHGSRVSLCSLIQIRLLLRFNERSPEGKQLMHRSPFKVICAGEPNHQPPLCPVTAAGLARY